MCSGPGFWDFGRTCFVGSRISTPWSKNKIGVRFVSKLLNVPPEVQYGLSGDGGVSSSFGSLMGGKSEDLWESSGELRRRIFIDFGKDSIPEVRST